MSSATNSSRSDSESRETGLARAAQVMERFSERWFPDAFIFAAFGVALVAIGLPVKRYQAAAFDGGLMILGTIYVVWFSTNFLVPFQGFLITLGVPLAAWTGIFCADLVAVRWRAGYDEARLFDSSKHGYGSVRWIPLLLMIACCVLGFGLVTNNAASWLAWQGYLLGPLGFGGRTGAWAMSNIGVLIALVLSFVIYLPIARRDKDRQPR